MYLLYTLLTRNFVNLSCHDEVAFRQPVDFVRPDLHTDFPPGKIQVRMMPFLLGDGARAIYKFQRPLKIGEIVRFGEVVFVHHVPAAYLPFEVFELGPF